MPRSITYVGGIYRRQGRWREAVASYERALSLDPRNAASLTSPATITFMCVTGRPLPPVTIARWKSTPDYVDAKIGLAYLEVFRNANPAAGRSILENIPASLDSDG